MTVWLSRNLILAIHDEPLADMAGPLGCGIRGCWTAHWLGR
jgi:hypothetical protein